MVDTYLANSSLSIMSDHKPQPVVRYVEDCETQEWNHPLRGHVKWWELINGDTTSTTGITMGIAEVPVGALPPRRGHTHDAEEVYVVLYLALFINIIISVHTGTTSYLEREQFMSMVWKWASDRAHQYGYLRMLNIFVTTQAQNR